MKLLIILPLPVPPNVTSNLLDRNISLRILILEPPQPAFLLQCEAKFHTHFEQTKLEFLIFSLR